MTDEARIARLTELARKAWPRADAERMHVFASQSAAVGDETEELLFVGIHPRALDALEAALCVLAGEPPTWARELAEEWRSAASQYQFRDYWAHHKRALEWCAEELLAAAPGKP